MLDQLYGLQQHGYDPSPEYHNQHTRRPQYHNTVVAYDPVVHRQHTQAYSQMPSARPTVSQYGSHPHLARHDIDHQQYHLDYSEDSEGSSTAAVVGSRIADSVFAPQQARQNHYATTQTSDPCIQPARPQLQQVPPIDHGVTYSWTTGLVPEQYYGSSYQHGGHVHRPMAAHMNDPYIRPARSQHQHELPVDHGVTHSWTTGPAPGGYNAFSYQQGGHTQHPLNLHASAPSVPNMNSGPVPTSYNNRPQARFDPAQAMTVPPPEMYAPAPAPTFLPTNHLGVPVQPQSADVLYAAAYQFYPPPPVNDPSGGLSTNNAVDQDHHPRVNVNENILNPTLVSPEATRPPKEHHRRNKRKGKEEHKVLGRLSPGIMVSFC
ncbi:hypothetical protein Q7P35_007631 [Cladosporium inversicolor]